jgi:hypothetical protein
MSGAVRGFGALNAVEPGHDEIERLTLDDGVANTALEVLEARPQIQLFIFEMEVKVDLIALVFLDSSAVKSAVLRSLPLLVSVVLAMVPLTPTPIFSPFSSSTGTILIFCKKAEDICTVFIMVCVTDGSTENFLLTSSGSMPFSSATRDR